MTDLPPELFAERPVHSDDESRWPSYAVRRFLTVSVLALLAGGGLYWVFSGVSPTNPQDIPVIKGEGTYKQRPDQPGGIDIPHQDVQVYQELDSNSNDKPPAEHLLPPPETPQPSAAEAPMAMPQPTAPHVETLMSEENPGSNVSPRSALVPTTVANPAVAPSAPQPSQTVTQPATPAPVPVATVPPAPVPVPMPSPAPVAVSSPSPTLAPLPGSAPAPVPAKVASGSIVLPAPQSSLKPAVAVRPAIPTPAAGAVSSAKPKSEPLTIDQIIKDVSQDTSALPHASPLPKGGVIIQLASLPDQKSAETDAHQLQNRYAAILGAVTLHIVRADLAKGVYYRIQGQAKSEQQAREICASLKKMNAGCILVSTR